MFGLALAREFLHNELYGSWAFVAATDGTRQTYGVSHSRLLAFIMGAAWVKPVLDTQYRQCQQTRNACN